MHQPSADQQRSDDLELSAQVHQEVHRELEPKDSHVELEHAVDAPVGGLVPRIVAAGRLDDADAEPAYDLDARSGAPVYRALHERNKDELGEEERECGAPHPKGRHGSCRLARKAARLPATRAQKRSLRRIRRSVRLLRRSLRLESLAPPIRTKLSTVS